MPVSFANLTPTNLQLTPMRVSFDGVDVGGTLGNVTINLEYAKAEMMADQLGKTVIDRRVSAFKATIVTEFAEVANKANMKIAFPHSLLVASGGNTLSYFQSMIGDGDLSNSHQLVLHPLALPNTDKSQDWLFYKACAIAATETVYGPEEQTRIKVTWNVLPDTSTLPPRFLVYGDPAVGIQNASGVVSGFVGTGGGSISSLTVFNGFTLTETITATCVTAVASGGVFNVNGSISGPLGLATVGVTFNSNKVSFLINDGTPDFAVNDVFTIVTTAANYT